MDLLHTRPHTPLADSYMRARLGLPEDFDLDSVPFTHLEAVAERLQREAEAEREKEAARQRALDALLPPKIIPRFTSTAAYLKGDRRIVGIASTGAINSHNYVLCPGGADIVLPVPLLVNHDAQKCVGSIESAKIDDEGKIHIFANLNSRCDASTWRRVQRGDLCCLSAAADPKTLPTAVKIGGIDHYFAWRLKEVSLCESGANHECLVTEIHPQEVELQPAEMRRAESPGQIETLAQFEQRLSALEDRLPLAYGGTWSTGQESKRGMFYTYDGSLWYCRETTRDRPGTGPTFQLAVKHGANGKDLR